MTVMTLHNALRYWCGSWPPKPAVLLGEFHLVQTENLNNITKLKLGRLLFTRPKILRTIYPLVIDLLLYNYTMFLQ